MPKASTSSIPSNDDLAPGVRAAGTRGRIGCGSQEIRVSDNSHKPAFRALIERLAAQPYVARTESLRFE